MSGHRLPWDLALLLLLSGCSAGDEPKHRYETAIERCSRLCHENGKVMAKYGENAWGYDCVCEPVPEKKP